METSMDRIERFLIEKQELDELGHRIVYDTKTGASKNIFGCVIDTSKLDERGFQVRL